MNTVTIVKIGHGAKVHLGTSIMNENGTRHHIATGCDYYPRSVVTEIGQITEDQIDRITCPTCRKDAQCCFNRLNGTEGKAVTEAPAKEKEAEAPAQVKEAAKVEAAPVVEPVMSVPAFEIGQKFTTRAGLQVVVTGITPNVKARKTVYRLSLLNGKPWADDTEGDIQKDMKDGSMTAN